MAMTKTKFIQFSRCPKYAQLAQLDVKDLKKAITYQEYFEEEIAYQGREILQNMQTGTMDDLNQKHLDIMLPYYQEVEHLSFLLAPNYFSGTFHYAKDTLKQECFECKKNGILYQCYVDIYNEQEDCFNIIEVKATTSSKFLNLGSTYHQDGEKIFQSIFQKNEMGIYQLLEDQKIDHMEMKESQYRKNREKLKDRYHPAGHYVYDLAVQRYIIENDLRKDGLEEMIPKIHYYLAVLNPAYEFDGTYQDGIPQYKKDHNGNDIITYIDMTPITKEMMSMIDHDRKVVEARVLAPDMSLSLIGPHCEYQKTTQCQYCDVCWQSIPKKNSIFHFIDQHHGFQMQDGKKKTTFELCHQGITKITDMKYSDLTRKKNKMQKEVIETHTPYIDIEKITDGFKQITYPIYHLDFETFPCPLPRYYKEHCYTQSVFQFSLHIEKEPGHCDKEKDHYEYLASDHKDHRKELVEKLCQWIDTKKGGTVLVYNESFEKARLLELSKIFPEYQKQLLKIRSMIFDLMWIIKGNQKLYTSLGYNEERSNMLNYYHEDMSGSFSIKKILPLFSDLSYQNMEIGNGMEALISYASFPNFSKEEYQNQYQKLLEYCKQDTWAMVEILNGIRKEIEQQRNHIPLESVN